MNGTLGHDFCNTGRPEGLVWEGDATGTDGDTAATHVTEQVHGSVAAHEHCGQGSLFLM
jgi:hypothetical protein